MSSILVATDFSPRSDRALRRAVLTARQIAANLVLLHALDDDLPETLLSVQRDASEAVLAEMADTIVNADQIECSYRLALGDPFRVLIDTARDMKQDIIVMGPHRRNLLKDIFIGTTIERTIRECPTPVIIANGIPASRYQRILIATDYSSCSVAATQAAQSLGLLDGADVTVLHIFDTPERAMMQRALMSSDEIEDYVFVKRTDANTAMKEFLSSVDIRAHRTKVQLVEMSVPESIRSAVRKDRPDLLVIGTHGRSGLEKYFLGSIAEEILRTAEIDVLIVPPSSAARAS